MRTCLKSTLIPAFKETVAKGAMKFISVICVALFTKNTIQISNVLINACTPCLINPDWYDRQT